MKKILFALVALLATTSMNAQVVKVKKGDNVVKTYTNKQADQVTFDEVTYVTSLSLDKTECELILGGTADQAKTTLTVTITPADATEQSVTWTSTDPTIAEVSEDGVVTAKKAGTATITAISNDGTDLTVTCEVTVKQLVTSLSLNKTAVELFTGADAVLAVANLKSITAPQDANDKSVTWTSTDPTIAEVSEDGKVTAHKAGSVTITATTNDGSSKSASCTVTVNQLVTSLSLNETNTVLTLGGDASLTKTTLIATAAPNDATDKTVLWSSENKAVAIVNVTTGEVTAVKAGEAKITATANDGSRKDATCNVTVKQLVTSLSLDNTSKELKIGENLQLTATALPTDATDKSVTWTSSNSTIASVTNTGKVTAIKSGNAVITATANDGSGKTATCNITVKQLVQSITLQDATVEFASTKTLSANVLPNNAGDKSLEWSSSDPNTVSVTQDGVVKALKVGSATITAKAKDGSGVTGSCTITVPKVRPGFVSAPSYTQASSSEGPEKLVDNGGTGSKWCCFSDNNSFEIIVSLKEAGKLLSFDLYNGNDTHSSYPERIWKSITVYGSSSSTGGWSEIYKTADAGLTSNNGGFAGTLDVNATTAYQYYKFVVGAAKKNETYDGSKVWNYKQQMSDMLFNVSK